MEVAARVSDGGSTSQADQLARVEGVPPAGLEKSGYQHSFLRHLEGGIDG